MRLVLDLADEITVLDEGEVVARGDPQQVIRDPIVAKVYLGERAESKSRNAIEATSTRLETSGAVSGGVGLEASGALRVEGLHAGYGAVRVVEGVSLHAERGEIVGVLGRNGVGKTTLMSAIAGLRFGCNSGAVTCFGRQLQEASPVEVVSSGIALVPEGRRIFKDMTVAENLEIGAYTVRRGARHEVRKRLEHVLTVFPPLTRILGSVSGNLSGGQQQMLAVGQALMAQPSVLLLDEPTAGLAPLVVESLFGAIMQLRDEGLAIVVVEQDLERALRLCNRYYVMDSGRMMVEGNTVDAEIEYLTQLILGSEPSAVLSAQKLP